MEKFKNLYDFIDLAKVNHKYPGNTANNLKSALKIFEKELNDAILKKNTSPLLATPSTHFARNFHKEDRYNFCPDPLHFVFHGQVDALKDPKDDLLKSL